MIAVGNQKGGVGKTTNTVHLAAALGERGKKCLIWDLDVNCGSTRHFGIPDGMNILGTFEVLVGDEKPVDVIVRHGEIEGVDLPKGVHLLPAHTKLEGLDRVLAAKNAFVINQDVLLKPLQDVRDDYDYIFLDTAPNLTTPTVAAYKAADYFILSTIPESFAVEGLNSALGHLKAARESGNEKLKLMGVIVGAVPGKLTRLARELLAYVDKTFYQGDQFTRRFDSPINASTLIPTVQKQGKTLFQVEPDHKITQQYRDLANELEQRFEKLGRAGESKQAPARKVRKAAHG